MSCLSSCFWIVFTDVRNFHLRVVTFFILIFFNAACPKYDASSCLECNILGHMHTSWSTWSSLFLVGQHYIRIQRTWSWFSEGNNNGLFYNSYKISCWILSHFGSPGTQLYNAAHFVLSVYTFDGPEINKDIKDLNENAWDEVYNYSSVISLWHGVRCSQTKDNNQGNTGFKPRISGT